MGAMTGTGNRPVSPGPTWRRPRYPRGPGGPMPHESHATEIQPLGAAHGQPSRPDAVGKGNKVLFF